MSIVVVIYRLIVPPRVDGTHPTPCPEYRIVKVRKPSSIASLPDSTSTPEPVFEMDSIDNVSPSPFDHILATPLFADGFFESLMSIFEDRPSSNAPEASEDPASCPSQLYSTEVSNKVTAIAFLDPSLQCDQDSHFNDVKLSPPTPFPGNIPWWKNVLLLNCKLPSIIYILLLTSYPRFKSRKTLPTRC